MTPKKVISRILGRSWYICTEPTFIFSLKSSRCLRDTHDLLCHEHCHSVPRKTSTETSSLCKIFLSSPHKSPAKQFQFSDWHFCQDDPFATWISAWPKANVWSLQPNFPLSACSRFLTTASFSVLSSKSLGFIFDTLLPFTPHIQCISKSCHFVLYNIFGIWSFLQVAF